METLKNLLSMLTTTQGIVAALIAIFGAVTGAWRWLRLRVSPTMAVKEVPVVFAGRRRDTFIERVGIERIEKGLLLPMRHGMDLALDLIDVSTQVASGEQGRDGTRVQLDEAFARSGRQLLILGPPGAGKTTEALRLMSSLLEKARADPGMPVPELFSLASWRRGQDLVDWLANQLNAGPYGWPAGEAKSLISQGDVVPFLDGLDEVQLDDREACVLAINAFRQNHRSSPLVVCCRLAEYDHLPRLKLGGAVLVASPDVAEVDRYLAHAGPEWNPVRVQFADPSSPLRELLSTPLMLKVCLLAYQEGDPAELASESESGIRARLWSVYVSTMLTRAYDPDNREAQGRSTYPEAQARRWLAWLAAEMRSAGVTELWLHEWPTVVGPFGGPIVAAGIGAGVGIAVALHLGMFWPLPAVQMTTVTNGVLRTTTSTGLPTWPVVASCVVAIGAVCGATIGGIGRLGRERRGRSSDRDGLLHSWRGRTRTAQWCGDLFHGVVFGLTMFAGTLASLPQQMEPPYDVLFSWRRIVARSILFGLLAGVATGLLVDVRWGTRAGGVVFIATGLVASLLAHDVEGFRPMAPMEILLRSAHVGVAAAIAVAVTVLALTFQMSAGTRIGAGALYVGLVVGLRCGLAPFLLHHAFRVRLRTRDVAPLRWREFLDWAASGHLLQSDGPAYKWFHVELRDYLSTLENDAGRTDWYRAPPA